MKKIILIALVAVSITSQAQPVYVDRIGFKLESIDDIDIGWMEIRKHTAAPKGKQLGNRIYSAKQIDNCQKFVEWMQQSYLPKGCLGDATYFQNYIPTFSGTNSRLGNAINMHAQALPLMYGAQTKVHMFLKKDAQGKFVPQTGHGDYWYIEANQLQYISNPVSFISSPDEYYFVMPDYSSHSKGYTADDKAASNLMGFANHKNIAGYKHFYVPHSQYVVIITKDNEELPFEKITIGEFFTQAEKQLPIWQKTDPTSAENFALAQKNLARLKEKYKIKWNDVAELKLSGTQITLYDFVNAKEEYDDMFDNKDIYGKAGVHTTFPILKVKKTALALCKTNQPQWLVIRWTMSMPNQQYNIHLHESVLNNFNFEYAYDYFFNPEKVKGQTYKPLRSPSFKEAVVVTEASEASKKNTADKNIHFFEDFSTNSVGKKPIGWRTQYGLDGGVIEKLDGLNGNWILITGNTIIPNQLKKPLPQNFTLTYDVVASQNFTWGAKGLTMQLSKETSPGNVESFLSVKLRPGFDGRDGQATLETKFPSPPGYSNGSNWYDAPGFSNNKKNNRITVTIKKKEETLQVFIDNTLIADYQKAIPAAHLFNALSFYSYNSGTNDKFYISNIKIAKD
jgi:hypothetical protein